MSKLIQFIIFPILSSLSLFALGCGDGPIQFTPSGEKIVLKLERIETGLLNDMGKETEIEFQLLAGSGKNAVEVFATDVFDVKIGGAREFSDTSFDIDRAAIKAYANHAGLGSSPTVTLQMRENDGALGGSSGLAHASFKVTDLPKSGALSLTLEDAWRPFLAKPTGASAKFTLKFENANAKKTAFTTVQDYLEKAFATRTTSLGKWLVAKTELEAALAKHGLTLNSEANPELMEKKILPTLNDLVESHILVQKYKLAISAAEKGMLLNKVDVLLNLSPPEEDAENTTTQNVKIIGKLAVKQEWEEQKTAHYQRRLANLVEDLAASKK